MSEQICPSNAIFMTYMAISSCADIRQLCQYIYFISMQQNQKHHHKYWHTYLSHYWNMSPNKYACHKTLLCYIALIMYSTCIPNITTHTSEKQQFATFNYHAISIYVPITNMTLKCHRYATYANYICVHMRQLCQYIYLI